MSVYTTSPRIVVTDAMRPYTPQGAAVDILYVRDVECLAEGPAGTGKSLACLTKLHACAELYPGMRGLMLRKTRASQTESSLVTWEHEVVPPGRLRQMGMIQRRMRQSYVYPNGSEIVVGGLDLSSRIMSTQYDFIYVQEATELTEAECEEASTRLRNGVMPYQILLMDCNPQEPAHWLNARCESGTTRRILCRHRDNPAMWDEVGGEWTPYGIMYRARLDKLTGVRRLRLAEGKWAAAEGQVYEEWDPRIHVIDRDAVPPTRRVFAAVDWGFTNPGVIGLFAEDGDGRLYLIYEYYMTHRTIDWWIAAAKGLSERFRIERFVCDPAEPAYIMQFVKANLPAMSANNAIAPGINAVQRRLKIADDGKPRLFLVRDALVGRDEDLVAKREPWSTAQEFDSYVWPKDAAGKAKKEKPVDAYNHGLDMLRYAVSYRDLVAGRPFEAVGGGVRQVQMIRQ